jgi:diguanylate cyclase (GGDEF)-like protein
MNDVNENRDPLTGLWNRKYALERLENAVEDGEQVAFIFIDIDRMKSFNDQRGHQQGDEKIIEIGREIEFSSGRNALCSRFGGDEFGVIVFNTTLQEARDLAEKIRAHRKPYLMKTWDGKEVVALTLSLGIAHFPTHVINSQNLLYAVEIALLKAKRGGRLPDGTPYIGRNRVMAFGDFLDEFPEQSARFLRNEFAGN